MSGADFPSSSDTQPAPPTRPLKRFIVRCEVAFDVVAPGKAAARKFVDETIEDQILTLADATIAIEEVKDDGVGR